LASKVVLDASAILALLFSEPGCDTVAPLLEGALASAVNLAEVHAVLVGRGVDAEDAWRQLQALGCEICPMDEGQARIAGGLIGRRRIKDLSLGDGACLALAIQRSAVAYTTNAAWKKLGLDINVELLP
jgi:ribonuclease VapC